MEASSPGALRSRGFSEVGTGLEAPRIPCDFDGSVNGRVVDGADLVPEGLRASSCEFSSVSLSFFPWIRIAISFLSILHIGGLRWCVLSIGLAAVRTARVPRDLCWRRRDSSGASAEGPCGAVWEMRGCCWGGLCCHYPERGLGGLSVVSSTSS